VETYAVITSLHNAVQYGAYSHASWTALSVYEYLNRQQATVDESLSTLSGKLADAEEACHHTPRGAKSEKEGEMLVRAVNRMGTQQSGVAASSLAAGTPRPTVEQASAGKLIWRPASSYIKEILGLNLSDTLLKWNGS
jgi:hypothetical protein